jgi:hypothetical protein
MKIYKLPDGRELKPGMAFVLDRVDGETIQLPGNWLYNASKDELAEFRIEVEEIPDPESKPMRRTIEKRVIIDRLNSVGLLSKARAAMDSADLYTRERWNALSFFYVDYASTRGFLSAIGADPDAILGE